MWALQALAQPAATQKSLFPDYVCVADELSNDFGDALLNLRNELNSKDIDILLKLDNKLDSISGKENAEYWTNKALEDNEIWKDIRQEAVRILNYFNWKNEPPPLNPTNRGITYVRGK